MLTCILFVLWLYANGALIVVCVVLATLCWVLCFFFFSSRRRHTRCLSDWSSDVCSSDLNWLMRLTNGKAIAGLLVILLLDLWLRGHTFAPTIRARWGVSLWPVIGAETERSEERRVGKEGRSRGSEHRHREKEWYRVGDVH